MALIPIADLTGPQGPAGQDALGTEPQQEVIAEWMSGDTPNPVSDELDERFAAMQANSEIAYVENISAYGTNCGTPGDSEMWIPGMICTVPPSEADVYIKFGGTAMVMTSGQGQLALVVYDESAPEIIGVPSVDMDFIRTLTAHPVGVAGRMHGAARIGPSDELRAYGLAAILFQETNALTGWIRNNPLAGYKTWMGAYV